jgi:hypothetical protein
MGTGEFLLSPQSVLRTEQREARISLTAEATLTLTAFSFFISVLCKGKVAKQEIFTGI